MNSVYLEYLAGFFGEGCICCKTKRAICIEMGNTNPHLLKLFKDRVGGHIDKQNVNKKS